MTPLVTQRLWPVSSVLVTLLAGAVALELAAENERDTPLIIRVEHDSALSVAEEASEVEGMGTNAAPLDADHVRARLAGRRGEWAIALPLLRTLAAAHPDAAPVQAELGFWLLTAGDAAGAAAVLARAHALAPEEATIAYNLGLARKRSEDAAGAERAYREALAVHEFHTPSRLALAALLRQRGAFAEALAVLESAIRAGSNDETARSLVAYGRVQIARGDAAGAARSFERALERAPARVDVRLGIARAYLASDDPAHARRAVETLRKAAELAPDLELR